MAEFDTTIEPVADDTDRTPKRRSGPSVLLLLSSIAALLVSAWALVGPFQLDFVAALDMGWILVAAAVIVGVVLVVLPGRRNNSAR